MSQQNGQDKPLFLVVTIKPRRDRLADHGYLAPMPPPKPTGGRPASPRYKVHALVARAAKHAEG